VIIAGVCYVKRDSNDSHDEGTTDSGKYNCLFKYEKEKI